MKNNEEKLVYPQIRIESPELNISGDHLHSDEISYLSDEEAGNGGGLGQLHNVTQESLSSQLSQLSSLSKSRRDQLQESVNHYEVMDKHITRMPQFCNSDEFLECLSHFTFETESFDGLHRFKSEYELKGGSTKYEVIIENQRGATVFGSKMYSKQSILYPLDPPQYQTLAGHNLTSLSMYPEPGKNWRWAWDKWNVMMINDVDSEGWIYSKLRFGSYHWSGVGKFGNFVRRRIWIRMAQKMKDPESGNKSQNGVSGLDSDSDYDSDSNPDSDEVEAKHEIRVLSDFKDVFHKRKKNIHGFSEKLKDNLFPFSKAGHERKYRQADKKIIIPDSYSSFRKRTGPNGKVLDSAASEQEGTENGAWSTLNEQNSASISHQSDSADAGTDNKEHEELDQHMEILNTIYKELDELTLDRQISDLILNSLFAFELPVLNWLLSDYKAAPTKSEAWLFKCVNKMKFNESRVIFLKKFGNKLEKDSNSAEHECLKQIYCVFQADINERIVSNE